MGGRGSSFGGSKRGIFGNGGSGKPAKDLLPVQLNRTNVTGDRQRMLEHFAQIHAGRGHEFAALMDENGFVTSYLEGESGSVAIPKAKVTESTHITHNHPHHGWGNFSGEDIAYMIDSGARSISASSLPLTDKQAKKWGDSASRRRAGTYTIERGTHFNGSGLYTAIKTLKVNDKDYDRQLARWLKANQKTYGYTYSYKPAK